MQALQAELDSLAAEIIHAYEELHLLYELSDGLTASLSVSDVGALILDKLLHALQAGTAQLSLPSGASSLANPALVGEPEHRLITPLRSAGSIIGQLEITRPSTAEPFSSADGKVVDAVGTLAANAIRNAQLYHELRQSEGHLRAVLDNVAEGIITVDEAGRIASFNPAAEKIFDYPAAAVLGRDVRLLVETSSPGETTARRRGGQPFPIDLTVGEMRLDNAHQFVLGVRDITLRKQAEAALEHQALHDTLTDLPNRVLLRRRLEAALADGSAAALLIMDLDRFKEVNDTFGHQYGDLLLMQIGERLGTALSDAETIARLGGDEFALLLPRASAEHARATAARLLEVLDRPFAVGNLQLEIDASIGIAMSPEHGTEADSLLRRADVAMYVAKRGGAGHAIYDVEDDQHSPARLALVGELRRAIERNELSLFFQPKVDYRACRVKSVEALVRWDHPKHGLLAPDRFIPLAEQTGLIRPLARWVLEAALRESRRWYMAGQDISVAVNLSMRNLHDPEIAETIRELLGKLGVPPIRLMIEITESSLMADAARAMDVLTRVRNMGVGISIDDFGTGYSSLAYLKRLPVDELKIDRSFVSHMASDENDLVIVRSTIGLAHDLGLTVVAEGIEDLDTWALLEQLGCDVAQGYLVSHPLPADELNEWLNSWQPETSHFRAA